jgi:hypothetical protein
LIHKTADVVFPALADFNIHMIWSPWNEKEPDAANEITGVPQNVGHKWEWKGDIIGHGTQTITSLEKNKHVKTELSFIKPQQSHAYVFYTLEPKKSSTWVTWGFTTKARYPLGRYMGLFLERFLAKDFEHGLENLKNYLEK